MYKCPATALRAEQSLAGLFHLPFLCVDAARKCWAGIYLVLAYLLFFRLEEQGAYRYSLNGFSTSERVPLQHACSLRLTVPEFRQFLLCGYGALPAINALMQPLGPERHDNDRCSSGNLYQNFR